MLSISFKWISGVENVRKVSIVLLSLVLLSSFIFGCDKTSDIIGEVNGEPITSENYASHLNFLKFFYTLQTEMILDEEKDQAVMDTLKSQTFDDLVLEKILRQQADIEGIEITAKEIKEEIEIVKSSHGDENYKSLLQEMGMTENQLKEQIKTQKIYAVLREKITADIIISEQEVRQYYQDNIDQFVDQGGMQLSHILIDTEEKAKEILIKLEKGENFADLAEEFSSCPSGAQGGDLGLINKDSSFVTEFKEAALQLKSGEMTEEPIKSEFGFHIIKAGEMQEAKTASFEEIEKGLHQKLSEDKKVEFFNNYLEDLRNKAEIKDWREDKSVKESDTNNIN